VSFGLFHFIPLLTSKLDARNKMKKRLSQKSEQASSLLSLSTDNQYFVILSSLPRLFWRGSRKINKIRLLRQPLSCSGGRIIFMILKRGGLYNKALRSLRELWSFSFYSFAYKQA